MDTRRAHVKWCKHFNSNATTSHHDHTAAHEFVQMSISLSRFCAACIFVCVCICICIWKHWCCVRVRACLRAVEEAKIGALEAIRHGSHTNRSSTVKLMLWLRSEADGRVRRDSHLKGVCKIQWWFSCDCAHSIYYAVSILYSQYIIIYYVRCCEALAPPQWNRQSIDGGHSMVDDQSNIRHAGAHCGRIWRKESQFSGSIR